jgi:SAM-dependent methyltransferase
MTKKNLSKIKDSLEVIRKAYDKTVDNYIAGIKDEDLLPEDFINSERYKRFKKIIESNPGGREDSQIFNYLNPKKDMKFLDVGSCANLIRKKLYEWPSEYYGIDISPKLIKASKDFVEFNNIKIGGLYIADISNTPFDNNFFDICSIIGVLEYYNLEYIRKSLKELQRILKPNSKIVIDIPNFNHTCCSTMIEMEGYLGRTRNNIPTNEDFETELKRKFTIDRIDSQIMKVYFARSRK